MTLSFSVGAAPFATVPVPFTLVRHHRIEYVKFPPSPCSRVKKMSMSQVTVKGIGAAGDKKVATRGASSPDAV